MGRLGFSELLIILVIILVIFGAGKLPQVMKSLGEGFKSFRKAAADEPQKTHPENNPAASSQEESKNC